MRKLSRKTCGTIPLLLVFLAFLSIATVSADVEVPTEEYTGITIDGQIGDWSGISGTKITLVRPLATSERLVNGLEVRTAYDDSNFYLLALVTDDFDYNVSEAHKSGSISVLFAIDDAATPDMGGGNGYVDIWHWELEVGPGVVAGFNLSSGNDPVGNLDDEYSLSPFDRHDDSVGNEVYGAWSHTNMTAVGASGRWIFEFKRALTTSDTLKQDVQFEVGNTYKMAIAYWDADELGEPGVDNGWTEAGHYATCRDPATLDFSWIDMPLKTPAIDTTVQDLQGDVTQLTNQIDALSDQIDTLNGQIEDLDVQGLQNEVTQLTGQANSLNGRIDSLTTMLYVAIAVAAVGILIGVAGVVFARRKT